MTYTSRVCLVTHPPALAWGGGLRLHTMVSACRARASDCPVSVLWNRRWSPAPAGLRGGRADPPAKTRQRCCPGFGAWSSPGPRGRGWWQRKQVSQRTQTHRVNAPGLRTLATRSSRGTCADGHEMVLSTGKIWPVSIGRSISQHLEAPLSLGRMAAGPDAATQGQKRRHGRQRRAGTAQGEPADHPRGRNAPPRLARRGP